MSFFSFGRTEGFPSQYPSKHTPVTIDVTEVLFISVFVIIAIAYLCIVLGYSKRRSIHVIVQLIFSISIGCLIMVENFGQEWEVGWVKTKAPYRAGVKQDIQSSIGLKIGLRSINITLTGEAEEGTPLEKETIDYNERFFWTWDQGRFGFGPYAGLLQRSFRDAQRRGLPIPILSIAEYFTIDGEGIRFGRFYRTAGWYCHILLCERRFFCGRAAFAGWILVNIFLQSVGRHAAYIIGTVGCLQLLTCIVWTTIHNPMPLVIPFEDGAIRVSLGRHFWMTLFCGILCLFLAVIIMFMDLRYPNVLSTFLGIDPLNLYDEYVVMNSSELNDIMPDKSTKVNNTIEMENLPSTSQSTMPTSMVVLRRRSTIKHAQKSLLFRDIEAVYTNQHASEMPEVEIEMESSKPPVPRKLKKKKAVDK